MNRPDADPAPIVIVGSGLAGYTLARELRKLAPAQPISLVTAEDGHFYAKPSLSNALAQGRTAAQLVTTPADAVATQLHLDLRPRTTVLGIDGAARRLTTSAGELPYAALVLAVGADPIRLDLAGDAADEVLSVNSLADYAAFRARIEGRRRVVLLGAGLIGCEFANDLASAGFHLEVVDPAPQPLGRLLPPAAGTALRHRLAAAGVGWHLGTTAVAVRRNEASLRVELADGSALAADAVLSAVGLRPRTALARAAGIATNRGIVVDRQLHTSVAGIYALGDCAEVEGLVLPFVAPLLQAARALAKTLAGTPTPLTYPAMPVVVKTPAAPLVVAPPPADTAGAWRLSEDADGIDARFEDALGNLHGFVLLGAATARRHALAGQLPALLG